MQVRLWETLRSTKSSLPTGFCASKIRIYMAKLKSTVIGASYARELLLYGKAATKLPARNQMKICSARWIARAFLVAFPYHCYTTKDIRINTSLLGHYTNRMVSLPCD